MIDHMHAENRFSGRGSRRGKRRGRGRCVGGRGILGGGKGGGVTYIQECRPQRKWIHKGSAYVVIEEGNGDFYVQQATPA